MIRACAQPPVGRWVMACPSAVVPRGWWPDGLSHQEAPQADGEEEAPQAAEEDAHPAQEQEVAARAARISAGRPPRPAGIAHDYVAPVWLTARPRRTNAR